MDRERRITIKYFLLKEVQGIQINNVSYYPMYVKILANTLSTRFRVPFDRKDKYYSEDDLVNIHKDNYFASLTNDLKSIIRYEFDKVGSEYRLAGIRGRLRKYFIEFNPFITMVASSIVDSLSENTNDFEIKSDSLSEKYYTICKLNSFKKLSDKEKTVIATAFYLESFIKGKNSKVYQWEILNIKNLFFVFLSEQYDNQLLKKYQLDNVTVNSVQNYINEQLSVLMPYVGIHH